MPPPDLQVTPGELQAAGTALDGIASDLDGQAGKLDGLFLAAAGGAGNPGLADSLGRAAWDFAGYTHGLAAEVQAVAGRLRGAAAGYAHADATAASQLTTTPVATPGGPR